MSRARDLDQRVPLPPHIPRDAHKGRAGRVLIFAGSADMPGAAILAARAAQRAGAGLVRVVVDCDELRTALPIAVPEAVMLDMRAWSTRSFGTQLRALVRAETHAWLVGPGLGSTDRTRSLVRAILGLDKLPPLVLDADALNVLDGDLMAIASRHCECVLTPHPGEAERLLQRSIGSTVAARREAAFELARRAIASVVLKGSKTIVVNDEHHYYENDSGHQGLATAGSGDVLAGILVAYLAGQQSGLDPAWGSFDAARAAVYVHGLAADLARPRTGVRGLIASDLIEALPAAQIQRDRRELR